ncbi:bZIP transcription factor 11-like [Cynara cardunculus var. scolymus]|uniref:Basic-leucine zipper domain-containing protein n=1 Tax=Cynara cardunculus var. scolymus TaxID=59895 RepID=A0A103XWY9_CYNCS|nr:bZIP transcription factor 11-like [Cynara cardunculus var. scolymus]KVH98420.1 Basic-leucine zipper domain-containing protein [Cynara cardunculus var. scolymus]
MASSSGNSSGIHHSGSEDGLTDQRKRKRMESNRESARRSRMRKQQQLNDLLAQANQLKKDNSQILNTIDVTTQRFVQIEADNSVLRAQVSELSQRLDSLNEIINFINANTNCTTNQFTNDFDFVENPWNMMYFNHNQQPLMASAADMFGY